MQPFYVQALLYGVAPEVLVNVAVVAVVAVALVAARARSAADARGSEETEK